MFAWKAGTPRILASNTKLFTSSAALARFGTEGTLGTEVLGDGELDENGVWRGNLYLRGGGDPTFGSSTYTRRFYGGGATVQQLAKLIDRAGVERVTGRVSATSRATTRCAAAPTRATASRSGSGR